MLLIALLKQPKNKEHRDVLEKATVSEVDITGMGPVVLPKEIVTEAIILSDMFDLNELIALDLLGTGEFLFFVCFRPKNSKK